jgi:replication-associated recombination protein RarA
MTALTTDVLESLRDRRTAGAPLKSLASELGLTWQKVEKAIRHGFKTAITPKPTHKTIPARKSALKAVTALIRQARDVGPLTEKYRPRTLDSLVGQDEAARFLRKFARRPCSTAFIFEGETGTGKTSAAIALANALGCDLAKQEFGGVHVIASGEQTADAVREITRLMWNTPFHGSGWKVVIVNEADRMAMPAETVWLDRLEALPKNTVVVFTTNYAGKLPARFVDRCTRLTFKSGADNLESLVRATLSEIWSAEKGGKAPSEVIDKIITDTTQEGQLSFRRAVQALTVCLAK